jgi:hypothetical protein
MSLLAQQLELLHVTVGLLHLPQLQRRLLEVSLAILSSA